MSKNLDGIVAKIRDVRAMKRPEIEKNLERIDSLLAALRDTRGRASTVAASYPDLASALQGISFNDAENRLLEARAACEAALTRLRRDSINIGVAGKARQGKSQILQMLTGLGDKQIPTGDGGFCTASRSVVRNGPAQSATVHYLTESKLLKDKVAPSYAPFGSSPVALGLSPQPASIAAFVAMELPAVSDTASVEALENWKKVVALQKDLRNNPGLVAKLGASPESVPLDCVRKYLVKDNGEADYQVVDHVEILTPFEMNLPDGMTVYDLPGLEDPTPGIRETMLKSVSEDADIVLLLRMPKNTGDDWDAADLRTMNMLKSVYPADDVQPKDWIQLVLNLDRRPASHNENNVERMKSKAPSGFSPVVCDCGSKDAVREMVDSNIDALVSQAGRIDDLRIRQADEKLSTALGAARALYDALRNASGDVIAQESGFDFEKKWEEFKGDLRYPFRSQIAPATNKEDQQYPFSGLAEKVLASYFKSARAKFNALYEANETETQFPSELPVFSKSRIEKLMRGEDAEDVVNKAVRNQREAILKFMRFELTACCDALMNRYFEKVISIGFDGNPSLKFFGATDGNVSARDRIASFLASVRQSGSFPTIESAAEALNTFCITFEGAILPAIYSIREIDDFDPDRGYSTEDGTDEEIRQIDKVKKHILKEIPVADAEGRAKYLFNWLRLKSRSIISAMASGSDESATAAIAEHVAAAMKANYDAFAYRFIWGDDCENEWRRLADHNKAVFWKKDFDKASANSQLAKDWNAALSGFAAVL